LLHANMQGFITQNGVGKSFWRVLRAIRRESHSETFQDSGGVVLTSGANLDVGRGMHTDSSIVTVGVNMWGSVLLVGVKFKTKSGGQECPPHTLARAAASIV
jgi:hypothetical protein